MKVLGYQYTIDDNRDSDDLRGLGEFNDKQQIIRVASDASPQIKLSAVLHEVIEALNFHLELKLEHQAITGLESGLYQVLIDNGVDLTPLFP